MARKNNGAQKAGKQQGRVKLWFWRLVKTGIFASLMGVMVLGIFVAVARGEIDSFEDLKASPNGQMIRLRAADGTVIQSIGPSFGRWLTIDELPPEMKDAMVAVEDRRFYSHPGVDPIGISRSFWVRFQRGYFAQGGSTITQQLARNIYLNNNKEFGRKMREIILAMAMETKFSKDQILELYLNKVYFGGGAYGVDSASRLFFGHSAEKLSLSEAAIIAGLVKAPSRYAPTADPKAALGRAKVVVEVMQDAGMITAAQAASVKPAEVKLTADKPQNSVRYFTDWVLPQLDGLIKEREKPLDVWTTIDLNMQRVGTAAIQANAPRGAQGALVAIDRDGAVRAMVGGTDYVTSNYNRAVTAQRQPGSAWKLFVYLAALEAGFQPEDKVVDEPIDIDGWQPKNSGGNYSGEITIRTAFAYSKNTIAALIGNEVGTSTVANMARRFGITTKINTSPSMVLGTSETRLIDMTRAFAQVAANGRSLEPYGIAKVTTIDGDVIYQAKPPKSIQLVEPYVAGAMIDLMQSAVETGSGRRAQIGRPTAGKTGTTSSNKDGYFVGFSSGLTTGVWMGRDDAKPVGDLQGGRAPASAFAAFMRVAVAKRPVEKFNTDVTFPERLDEEGTAPAEGDDGTIFVDENGLPIEGVPEVDPNQVDEAIRSNQADDAWVDEILGRQSGGGNKGGNKGNGEGAKPKQGDEGPPENLLPEGF
ncbi:transglycosylase domain-containing protein [Sphingorhabdus arenilitoris]|uniref:peptidoglycan glycosyltransferase n=1 Tax=Sphingorhabdus arenilitoris TaxID=1490041 RepID=A0ABV8RL08_9SPHN